MFKNILIIDDNQFQNYHNRNLLRELGLFDQISIVHDGTEAISYLNNCKNNCYFPDLIFLDIVLPRMDGVTFMKFFNLNFSHIEPKPRIIALTAGGENLSPSHLLTLGVEKVIYKPLTKEKILEAFNINPPNSEVEKQLDKSDKIPD